VRHLLIPLADARGSETLILSRENKTGHYS
jgi:hypothetical protein